jgi:hypothetical protein
MAALLATVRRTGKRGRVGENQEKKERKRGVASRGCSRESSRPQGGKKEVASAQPCARHAAAQCPSEEDKGDL